MKRKLSQLLEEYRRGDDEARQELMEHIEKLLLPLVRKFMSSRLRLDRESIDVCQSLMMDFHSRAEQGKLDLESEQALRGYVRAMVRHKLANLADRMNAARRGGKAPRTSLDDSDPQAPSSVASPSLLIYAAEIHNRLREELTREEFAIFEGRIGGRTNAEIAEELDKSPDAVRMTWNRARDRLVQRGIVDGPGFVEPTA